MLRGREGPTKLTAEKWELQRKEKRLEGKEEELQRKLIELTEELTLMDEAAAQCMDEEEKKRIASQQQQLKDNIKDMRQERRACVERLKENSMQLTSVTRQLEALQTAPSSRGEFLQYICVCLLLTLWSILCRALRTGSCAVSL